MRSALLILIACTATASASLPASAQTAAGNKDQSLAECIVQKDPAKADEIFFAMMADDGPGSVRFQLDHPCFQGPYRGYANNPQAAIDAGMRVAEMRMNLLADCLFNNLTPEAKVKIETLGKRSEKAVAKAAQSTDELRTLVGTGSGTCNSKIRSEERRVGKECRL